MIGSWIIRFLFAFIMVCVGAGILPLQPVSTNVWLNGAVGLFTACAIVVFEIHIRRLTLRTLVGALIGSIAGIIGATLISLVLSHMTALSLNLQTFLQCILVMFMAYVGLLVGAEKGNLLNSKFLDALFSDRATGVNYKILDTSVVIDGRIADLCEIGFIDGILVVPQFVLNELQMVADSGESIKRNRGRRGLDILQRIQKTPSLTVQFTETDFPELKEVDLKLIELAKHIDGKIVTNDFNLNKVAQLRGVPVLNINELANALKPIVLPGEVMKVFILKEGKEENQGVAYLDDGTMVVVDDARSLIGKNVEVAVTSMLQTTAGKMIFGRVQRVMGSGGGEPRHDSGRAR